MQICLYHQNYAFQISHLFHRSVQQIGSSIYSQNQLNAWSFAPRSSQYWHNRLKHMLCFVMLKQDQCVGFIAMDTGFWNRGYISHLYTAPEYQGMGVASQLYLALEAHVLALNYNKLIVDASKLSAPVFSRYGFVKLKQSYQIQRGEMLQATVMQKLL